MVAAKLKEITSEPQWPEEIDSEKLDYPDREEDDEDDPHPNAMR